MYQLLQAIERYNAGLASADELDRDVSLENLASDYHTYAVSYDAHGHATLIRDGKRVVTK